MTTTTDTYADHRRVEPEGRDCQRLDGSRYEQHRGRCLCGWTGTSWTRRAIANRAAGLHVAKAHKRIERRELERVSA